MSPRAPGRRALFGGAAALLAGTGMPVGADASPDADAALIATCDRFIRAEAEWRRLCDICDDARIGTPEDAALTAFNRGEYAAAAAAVSDTPARTAAGLQAKARAVVAHFDPDPPDDGLFATAMWEIITAVAGQPVSGAQS